MTNNNNIEVIQTPDFEITGKGSSKNWNTTEEIILRQDPITDNQKYLSTSVKLLYSGTGMYFLFQCEDKILSATMKSDYLNLWEEDVVEIFLWPDENKPVYFEYELSPLNYELPLVISHSPKGLRRWRPFQLSDEDHEMTSHQTYVEQGKKEPGASISAWRAEFFINYELLRIIGCPPPVSGTQWRANFYRIDYDTEQTLWSWQTTKNSFHELDTFGTIHFV